MIKDGRATDQKAPEPDSPASEEVFGRYWAAGPVRWMATVSTVAWGLVGVVQLVGRGQWQGLAFAAAFAAMAVVAWVVPRTVISGRGVRILGRRVIPWSQVAEVVAPLDNGWRPDPPELVLCDGRRRRLEISASEVDGLLAFARKHGAPIPP